MRVENVSREGISLSDLYHFKIIQSTFIPMLAKDVPTLAELHTFIKTFWGINYDETAMTSVQWNGTL